MNRKKFLVIVTLIFIPALIRSFMPIAHDPLLIPSLGYLVFILFVSGFCVVNVLAERNRPNDMNIVETVFLSILISIALNSFTGLILACLGLFSLGSVLIINAVAVIVSISVNKQVCFGMRLMKRSGKPLVFMICILIIGSPLYFRPMEWIVGGRDPGVYYNTAINTARTGNLFFSDKVISLFPQEIYKQVFAYTYEQTPMFLPGYFIILIIFEKHCKFKPVPIIKIR